MACKCGTGAICYEHMKGYTKFQLKNGEIVDSLPPAQEEKLKRRMREDLADMFWRSSLKRKPSEAS